MIGLGATAEHDELARTASALVERHSGWDRPGPDPALWRDLADAGILGLCTPEVGGTPLDLAVAMEALGGQRCPGPLVATAAAGRLLDGDDLAAVVEGRRTVTITDGRILPWGDIADLVIEIDGDAAWLCESDGGLEPTATMSDESWFIGSPARSTSLGDAVAARALADVALGAYVVGVATHLVDRAADHAREREQFGRPIGDFQAVAHPLTRSSAELGAARELIRLAARTASIDGATGSAAVTTTERARRAACGTARTATGRVHQVMGAMGFSEEAGIALATTRVAQWCALPPVGVC